MSKEKIRYYKDFSTDFYESGDTPRLKEGYRWVRRDVWSRFLSAIIYGTAIVFSTVYCRLFLHVKIKGARPIRCEKQGVFLYGNHTQPIGDVFDPALACLPKRIYTVVSAANMELPVIGKILPYLGALPIPDSIRDMKKLNEAIDCRLAEGKCIVIYPEAHVWDYYTGIRPFPDTSFKYPAKSGAPVYSMTAVYKKRKIGKRPAIHLYIDGPFYAEGTSRERAAKLHDQVYERMKTRSEESDCEYIKYVKEG